MNNTPYYRISKRKLDENIGAFVTAMKDFWPNSILSYSVKTNSLPWLLQYLRARGIYAEVVSDEEFCLAELCGFSRDRIIFNGPVKGEKRLVDAVNGRSLINLDSVNDLEVLQKNPYDPGRIGIRINVNPDYFSDEDTAFKEDGFRFGFSDEGGGIAAALNVLGIPCNRKKVGLHFHCNSSTRSIQVYKAICKYAVYIIEKYHIEPSYIDIGGGFFGGVEGKPGPADYIKAIKEELQDYVDSNTTPLIVEPGSALIGSAVDLYSSVVDVKETVRSRIVTTDASRLYLDPIWKKSSYLYNIETQSTNTIRKQIICGFTCMDYDRIMTLKQEKELRKGDRIVYKRVGAYTMTFGGMFIRYLPDVYVEDGEQFNKVRSRITTEDYYRIHS